MRHAKENLYNRTNHQQAERSGCANQPGADLAPETALMPTFTVTAHFGLPQGLT
jgi:hypothetical protein